MRVFGRTTLAAVLACALLASPSGAGAASHPFLGATKPIYEDACGVAQSGGGLYVSDYYRNAIVTPTGELSPESQGSGPCKLEFDAAGNLYVNNWHQDVVRYGAGELLPGAGTVVDSADPTGLAVERSTGDVYVAHRTYVSKYSSAGALLQTIGNLELEEGYGVAVSEYPATAGDVYVPDAASGMVKVFDSGGVLIHNIDGAATPQGRFVYLRDGEIVIDNNPASSTSYGHVFVLDGIGHGLAERPAAAIDEFNAQGDYRAQVTGFLDAEPSGIAIDAGSHNLFVTSGNTEGSQVFEYGPTAPGRTLRVAKKGTGEGTVTSSPAGIACGSDCAAEYDEGRQVVLSASPDAHSAFAGWTVTGSPACPGTGTCTVLMSNTVEVQPQFNEPAQEELEVGVSGPGIVTSSPAGISCPSDCEEHFAQGRSITLSAAAAPHSRFVGWSGSDCDESVATTCKVEMTSAKAVAAQFEPIPQNPLSVSVVGSGQGTVTSYPSGISCPGGCSSAFDEGSTVYLMAAPSPGSGFAGFTGGGCAGTATLCVVTMASAQELEAHFTGAASGPSAASLFAISSVRTGAAGAVVAVATPEPGTLVASGAGLAPLERTVGAGATSLRLRLLAPARRRLSRTGTLRLRLSLGFAPTGEAMPSARTMRLRFHLKRERR
jgi:hypothetical protein